MKRTLKPGHGYWKTSQYPIGGCFGRSKESLHITVTRLFDMVHGCNAEGNTDTGEKIAFNLAYCEKE